MDGAPGRTLGLNVAAGDIIAGRYELHERLGSGGMGMVFRAHDKELDGEVVALKLLLPHLSQDENVFRRFRNEVLVARSLTHPNIVRTHDIGKTSEGYLYISMEYINGVSLRDRLISAAEAQSPLSFDDALTFLYQIICGVAYAHGKGVIHRDLKPANVLLSKSSEVKLADFGTARIVGADTSLTQTGQVIGTPDYMSPEQIRGETLDTSCDIYALGILAYELVSGKRPFIADSAVAVAFKHLNEPLPSLIGPGSRIPVWFDEIVRKAAAKKKNDRFASVNDLAGALLDFAPQLNAQSTLFSNSRRPGGSIGVGEALQPEQTQAAKAVQHPPSGANASSAATKERSFEFGSQQAKGSHSREDHGGWKLGALSDSDSDPFSYQSKSKRPASGLRWLWIAVAVLAVTLVLPRASSSINSLLQSSLFAEDVEPSSAALFTGALFGVRPAELPLVVAAKGAKAPLLPNPVEPPAKAPEPVSSAAPVWAAPGGVLRPADGVNTIPPAVSEKPPVAEPAIPDKAGTSPALVTAAVVAPPPATPPPATPTPPPVEKVSGSVALRENGVTLREASVAVDRLGQLTWSVDLSGIDPVEGGSLEAKLKNSLVVEVYDLRKGQAVANLKFDHLTPASKNEGLVKVSGGFQPLRGIQPSSGSFRVQALYKGNQIAAKELVLYRAQVVVSTAPGDERVSVVRGASVTGGTAISIPDEGPPVIPSQPVSVNPAASSSGGVPASATAPGTAVQPQTPQSGLPRAKGHERVVAPPPEPTGAVIAAVINPPVVAQPVVSASSDAAGGGVVSESYSGALIPNADGAQPMNIELRFQVSGESLSGSATIAGVGEFSLSGRVLARGMEIELNGDSQRLRLTSGPRGQSIRGRYTFPSQQQNGRLELQRR